MLRKSLFFSLFFLLPAVSLADCDPVALAGESAVPAYSRCLNSDCSQKHVTDLSDAQRDEIAAEIYARDGQTVPGSGTLTYSGGFTMHYPNDPPRYQPVGDVKFGCSYSGADPAQPEPVESFPIPGAADVMYSDNPSLKTIFERNNGPGLTELYHGDENDFFRYFLYEAPDWDPGDGGSIRPNSCSHPANRDPIDVGSPEVGPAIYVSCSAVDNTRYILYRQRVPKTCDRYPGYEKSSGACNLFAESLVKKPAGKLACEVIQRDGQLEIDPRNPDCSARIRTISENSFSAPLSGGGEMVVERDPTDDTIEVRYPDGSGGHNSVEFGPYNPSEGGRPITGLGHSDEPGGTGGTGGTGGDTGSGSDCGIPGKPACQVQIDDSAFADFPDQVGSSLDSMANASDADRDSVLAEIGTFDFLQNRDIPLKAEMTGFISTIIPAPNCSPLTFGTGVATVEIDICGPLEIFRDLAGWLLWIVCGLFLLSTFRRTTTQQTEA